MGPEEEGTTNYRLTSTVMLSLTTDNEPSGTFSLSGSLRRQVNIWFYSNLPLPYICLIYSTPVPELSFRYNLYVIIIFFNEPLYVILI